LYKKTNFEKPENTRKKKKTKKQVKGEYTRRHTCSKENVAEATQINQRRKLIVLIRGGEGAGGEKEVGRRKTKD